MSYAGGHLTRILDVWQEGMRQYCIDKDLDPDEMLTPSFILQKAMIEGMTYAIQLDAEGNFDAVRDVIAWVRTHFKHLLAASQNEATDEVLRYVVAAAYAQTDDESQKDGEDDQDSD